MEDLPIEIVETFVFSYCLTQLCLEERGTLRKGQGTLTERQGTLTEGRGTLTEVRGIRGGEL